MRQPFNPSRRRCLIAGAALADALAVVVFVALGRGAHDEGSALSGTVRIAAPFLLAAVLGWVASRAWRAPLDVWRAGVPIWVVTIVVGMLLRHTVFDRGTALPFVIVATGMVGLLLLGWRTVADVVTRRRGRAYDPRP